MDSEHGSGSSNGNGRDSLMPLISLTDSEQESESDRLPRLNPETIDTTTLGPTKKLYVSPASSISSSEDLFQMNPKIISKTSAKPLLRGDKLGISSDSSELYSGSTDTTTSLVSDLTHESMLQNLSPTQSPQIQLMERPRDYDSSRIPDSVFECKSPMPVDWSVASNESLFSIHLGNNSFSREHVLMVGGDSYKSGESNKSRETTKSHELVKFRPSPPVSVVGESERKSVDVGKRNGAASVFDEHLNYNPSEIVDDQSGEKLPLPDVSWDSSNTNQNSDRSTTTHNLSNESGASSQPFPFPIKKRKKKKKKSGWPKCHFCNCRWECCHCTLPRCYCSNCSWSFCYFWNCRRKGFCCFSSDILKDEGTSVSATSKKASKKWYSCFCCFSKCCRSWSCSNCCPSWSFSNCFSCGFCSNCFSCRSCSNCFSCRSFSNCFSCRSCSNCFSCWSCSNCFTCRSCSNHCTSCWSCSKCCSC